MGLLVSLPWEASRHRTEGVIRLGARFEPRGGLQEPQGFSGPFRRKEHLAYRAVRHRVRRVHRDGTLVGLKRPGAVA